MRRKQLRAGIRVDESSEFEDDSQVVCRLAFRRINSGRAIGVGDGEDFTPAIAGVTCRPVREVQRAAPFQIECLDVLRRRCEFLAVAKKAVSESELLSGS